VVAGEQSSGKSSVLQAVTDIPFAISEGMCTKFATEIVLRRNVAPITTHKVEIPAAPDLSKEEQKTLRDWQPDGVDLKGGLTKQAMLNIVSRMSKYCSQ
jgi:hypothetical protein